MASVAPPVQEVIDRVKNLFIDVPGTLLSPEEISRLAGVELPRCEAILDAVGQRRLSESWA
jgi:hypothetical protein